jgi:ribonuclease P protein component
MTGAPAGESPLGLPRERRLRRAGEFKRLYAEGRRLGNERFSVVIRQNELGAARLGLSVAARVARRAVERNRVRRLIRESFRHRQHELPPLDLVIGLRGPLRDVTNRELLDALDRLWHKVTSTCERSSSS